MAMPVYNDVDVILDGRCNHFIQEVHEPFGGPHIGVGSGDGLACAAIAVVILDAHGEAEHVYREVVRCPVDNGVLVVGIAGGIGPEKAHAS